MASAKAGATEKTCTKCNETKPLEAFSKAKKEKDGLRSECKRCQRLVDRERNRRRLAVEKPGAGENEFFSATYEGERRGQRLPADREERMDLEKARLEAAGLPRPQVLDLDGAVPVLDGIEDPALRERVRGFLTVLIQGGLHKDAMIRNDFVWNQWMNVSRSVEGLRDLYVACKEIGEEYRKVVRVDSAHQRAVDGVDDPIYSASGKFLGHRKLYSDRLLELLLKADDPERFTEKRSLKVEGTMVNLGVGFDRSKLREAEVEEVEDAAG